MEWMNLGSFSRVASVLNEQKNITRDNAGDEFLKMLCYKMVDKMFSETMLPANSSYSNMDLAKKLFAEKLAQQIKTQGTISEVNLK